ncbi:MAG: CotH kinase family protein [Saprospiraceae bacterium]|nr:CotH kinase family protein [Saprospiraceae bacterium]
MKSFKIVFLLQLTVHFLFGQDTITLEAIPKAGFYKVATAVKIQSNKPEAQIFYTTNGSKPNSYSKRYKGAILIDSTTVLRSISYINGVASNVISNSYFINEDSITLPVVSVSIESYILFDPVKGIFKRGPRASAKFPHDGANFYSRREYPCHIEIFETTKKRVCDMDVGFKIFGGMSRIFPQKSFSLYASKSRYGNKYIKHRIFPDKDQKKFKRLVLRNSGSDFGETHFRDALITSLGKQMGLEVQAYRPSVVFINGKYWGIYNFREKLTRHYIAENFRLDKDSINLIEHRKSIQAGSRRAYDQMRNFMIHNSLRVQENYDYVATQMDVDNFMEYQIIQIYIDNQDAGGNIKFWRPKKEGGKWRWILFDTDFGLGHYGRKGYKNNSLAFHTRVDGPAWPNPPWSTLNLRSLLQNKKFQEKFVTRFLDRINWTFDSSRIISQIDIMASGIMPELPRHWDRWDLASRRWYKEVDRMKEFSRKRPAFMRDFLHEMFPHFGDDVKLKINVDSNGTVIVNDIITVNKQFEGVYFSKTPAKIKAKPNFGYLFSHWEMDGERIEGKELSLSFTDTIHDIHAFFIKGEHPKYKQMIINEISFSDTLSGDWIEFYNNTKNDLNLEGWKIKASDEKEFVFPNITIKPNDYLVVSNNIDKFKRSFPDCLEFVEGMTFGIGNKREVIRVYDQLDNPVDSIGYDFSQDTIVGVQTIALKDFNLNNNNIQNWRKQLRAGSPASVNPDYVKIRKKREWDSFLNLVKMGAVTTAVFIVIVMAYITARKRVNKVTDN